MGNLLEPPNIYQFDDFRPYLKALFTYKKQLNPKLSTRSFAKETQLSNPGYLGDVIKGRRKLSSKALKCFLSYFKIEGAEEDYFRLLVLYTQSKKSTEREEAYRHLLFRRSRSKFKRINSSLVSYYEDYRYPLIRSAIEVCDFRGNFEILAKFLHPSLPVYLVKKMVADLVAWGLVQKNQNNKYQVTSRFVEPPPTLNQLVRRLNQAWLQQAGESIHNLPPEARHVSSILMGISKVTRKTILSKLHNFQEEIFKLIQEDQNPETLVQLSMAFFPRHIPEEPL